jgi:hypothetical protein
MAARNAEDVDWTVLGTHPLAGRYKGRDEFRAATFERLAGVLPDGVGLEVAHLHHDGDTAIVELRAYLDSMMVTYTLLRNEL